MADERSRVEDRNNERNKASTSHFNRSKSSLAKFHHAAGVEGSHCPISVISTGAISFDAALGVGGVPRGRVVEIFAQSHPAKRPSPCR